MKKTSSFIILFCILLITTCKSFSEEFYYDVSMTQLITTPERFKNKKISVIGYFSKDIDRIFLSKIHAEINDYSSSIYISGPSRGHNVLRDSSCAGKYIEVKGELWQTKNWPVYSIVGVKKVVAVKTGNLCWEKSK